MQRYNPNELRIYAFDSHNAGPCIGIGHPKCGWREEGWWEKTLDELVAMGKAHINAGCTPEYGDAT